MSKIRRKLPRSIKLPQSVRREALVVKYNLSAGASEEDVDAAIQSDLCAKYGLPITASNEEIAAKMHETRCARYHLDPATTSEAALDAHVADLLRLPLAA